MYAAACHIHNSQQNLLRKWISAQKPRRNTCSLARCGSNAVHFPSYINPQCSMHNAQGLQYSVVSVCIYVSVTSQQPLECSNFSPSKQIATCSVSGLQDVDAAKHAYKFIACT